EPLEAQRRCDAPRRLELGRVLPGPTGHAGEAGRLRLRVRASRDRCLRAAVAGREARRGRADRSDGCAHPRRGAVRRAADQVAVRGRARRLAGRAGRGRPMRLRRSGLRRTAGVEEATRRLLQYVVVPVWVGAGFADWLCHRRTSIETTAGTEESVIHALMMSEAGVPALLGLFFEVNAGVIATTLAALGLH